jgi:hypothetical protein
MTASLAAAGLLLGGYPGAVAVPALAGLLCVLPAGWRARLIGGAFTVALVAGAIGQHLILSGDGGPLVRAMANTIPQVICLMVVGGSAAPLLRAALEGEG